MRKQWGWCGDAGRGVAWRRVRDQTTLRRAKRTTKEPENIKSEVALGKRASGARCLLKTGKGGNIFSVAWWGGAWRRVVGDVRGERGRGRHAQVRHGAWRCAARGRGSAASFKVAPLPLGQLLLAADFTVFFFISE